MTADDKTNVLKIEFDCRPAAIVVPLALREPKHQETTAYCHFRREPFTKDTHGYVKGESRCLDDESEEQEAEHFAQEACVRQQKNEEYFVIKNEHSCLDLEANGVLDGAVLDRIGNQAVVLPSRISHIEENLACHVQDVVSVDDWAQSA